MSPLLECVPNFSEGRDLATVRQITDEIAAVAGVRLLHVDSGRATNRTVVTFVGPPAAVVEAAFRAIRRAGERIDLSCHQGTHPRLGATDVCPLIPLAGLTMGEAAEWARRLGERVGRELALPVYLYEEAQSAPHRRRLAAIRAGEYEGLSRKIRLPEWRPDFGPAEFDSKRGATVIGARGLLVAFNVNLDTDSVSQANAVAGDIRESGRLRRDGSGRTLNDEAGRPIRDPGTLRAVRALGWYIEEFGRAQVSMNLTDLAVTPLHEAFDEVRRAAEARGVRVTGSELVGLVPRQALVDAGRHYLRREHGPLDLAEDALIGVAIDYLGLSALAPFRPEERIIENLLRGSIRPLLAEGSLRAFADETARASPVPGGGSVAAYAGALGAALGSMVANLSVPKAGANFPSEEFAGLAEQGQRLKRELLALVDEDAAAFEAIMAARRLPRDDEERKAAREAAIETATRRAIATPFRTMQLGVEALSLTLLLAERGNAAARTDAGVGALCARASVLAAYLNVRANAARLGDRTFAEEVLREGAALEGRALDLEAQALAAVRAALSNSA